MGALLRGMTVTVGKDGAPGVAQHWAAVVGPMAWTLRLPQPGKSAGKRQMLLGRCSRT